MVLLAFSLQDQVEKYGAYVGIAAFFGLAVLSLLYFAQAREVKRLREGAGRAPERAAELAAQAAAAADARLAAEGRGGGGGRGPRRRAGPRRGHGRSGSDRQRREHDRPGRRPPRGGAGPRRPGLA